MAGGSRIRSDRRARLGAARDGRLPERFLFVNAFALIYIATKKFTGMMVLGFGDVRLAALLGLLLGWYGLQYVLYGAIAGHLLALAIAIGTCIHRRRLYVRYSFGPPLIAGALAVVLFQT